MRVNYHFKNDKKHKVLNFDLPFDFGLLFGGSFNEDFSFFGTWSQKYGLYKFFLRANSIFGPKNAVNLKFGKFEPGITDGYVGNQRLTHDYTSLLSYSPSGSAVGNPSADWSPRSMMEGLELSGILVNFFQYILGITKSLGLGDFVISVNKDYYARVAYKFGGYGLNGFGNNLDTVNKFPVNDKSFTLGLYSYVGNTFNPDSQQGYTNH